jgi:dihydrofolate synthase/folylpolyglutamate synthase
MSFEESFALYQRANQFLDEGLIRREPIPPDTRTRRQWMEWFLPRVGEPQKAFAAVHVAGTSGKGSVCALIAESLRAAGVRCGLHVSPYLQVSTEKLWVDGRYASAGELHALVEWIRPHCEACRSPEVPLHGLAAVAVALEHFRRRGVELAVVETGVGGRHDLTNVLQTRVAVISSVGLDHLKSLGPDLETIAWHKAGIIRPGCRAVIFENNAALPAAREQARAVGATLRVLPRACLGFAAGPDGVTRLSFRGRRWHLVEAPLAMRGAFQPENAALALAALEELGDAVPGLDEEAARRGLSTARLPARLETLPGLAGSCPVVLDGAHNGDKLLALLGSLAELGGRRLHLVYGALASRALDPAVARLAASAARLVITEPRVHAKPPCPAAGLRAALETVTAERPLVAPDPQDALEIALDGADPADLVLVTGSLYLCGELRGRWYPAPRVVAEQRSWF